MNSDALVLDLPLIELFHRLRHAGLPLGIDEYQALLRALRAGFGVSDRTALARLCKTLWVKSRDEELLFDYHFEQVTPGPITDTSLTTQPRGPQGPLEIAGAPSPSLLSPTSSEPLTSFTSASTSELTLRIEDEIQVARAIMYAGHEGDGSADSYLIQTDEYFPITRRQMKHSWRYLRRPGREGPPVELDVEATVDKIGRQGMLLEPVQVPRRVNHAELILLIDEGGSMAPFHALSRRLAETALRGGRLGKTGIYYFHNCPEEYLYYDPTYQEGEPVQDILEHLHHGRTGVLIFSDAGAARGGLNTERLKMTEDFLLRLKQHVRHIAWLNPMPRGRWYGTTGGEVAHLVPMFDISRRGLDDAISVLRGRLVPTARGEGLQIRPTGPALQRVRDNIARQRIEAFRKRYGQFHLSLAQQAAFPLALTPDLLYRLWASFPRDIHGEKLNIPWVAVSDLLLSSLCNEVDDELYEMNAAVRTELLNDLRVNPQLGSQRLNELSSFLLKYVEQQLESHDPDIHDFAQVQQWTVLAYTRPGEAARELALALHASITQNDVTEQIRMASLIETFAEPLVEFVPLLSYAKGVKSLARGDVESAKDQFDIVARRESAVEVQGVSLPVPVWQYKGTRDAELGVDSPSINSDLTPLPFHKRLSYERQRRGWSQADVAEKVACDAKTVSRWESGQRLPRPYHRQALCELFGLSAEEFGLLVKTSSTEQTASAFRSDKQEGRSSWEEGVAKLLPRVQVLINPFDISRPARLFVNRTEEMMVMRRELCDQEVGQALVLHGPRRSGKTSLSQHFLERQVSPPYWGALVSLQNAINATETTILMQIADKIGTAFLAQLEHDPPKWEDYTDNDPQVRFKKFLQSCLMQVPGSRLILALDEFGAALESFERHFLSLRFFTYWKELMNDIPQLSLIFVLPTSAYYLLNSKELANMFSFAMVLSMSFLDTASAEHLLADPLRDMHIAIHPNTLALAVKLTGGNPYYLSLIGQQLIFHLNRDFQKQVVSDDDLNQVIEKIIMDRTSQNFDFLKTELQNEEELVILEAMIDFMNRSKVREVQLKKLGSLVGMPVALTRQHLDRLRSGLILDEVGPPSNPFYSFKIELIRRWLSHNRSFFAV